MVAARHGARRSPLRLVIIAAAALAVLAMMRGFGAAFTGMPVGPNRVAARHASVVALGFFGGEQQAEAKPPSQYQAYEATDVTPADQAKALWENPTVQSIVSFLMAASTVLDVAGFFTGEVGTGIGITEALSAVDASTVASEGQAAVEALAQSGDGVTEAAQAVQEGGENIFDVFKGPSSK
mmetsp:Transcript_152297/g.386962  ORF Transcript_152297/g.386962 Transcript_152297/m.386962 type:complete len:181 (-) Transcript_152297:393-935(-)